MYRILFFIFLFVSFISCSNTNGDNDKHVKLIKTAIGLIARGNTDSLKMIIDTGYVYELFSKEGFEARILLAQKKIGKCVAPDFKLYKIRHPLPQTTEYTLEFCRSKA